MKLQRSQKRYQSFRCSANVRCNFSSQEMVMLFYWLCVLMKSVTPSVKDLLLQHFCTVPIIERAKNSVLKVLSFFLESATPNFDELSFKSVKNLLKSRSSVMSHSRRKPSRILYIKALFFYFILLIKVLSLNFLCFTEIVLCTLITLALRVALFYLITFFS